MNGLAWLCHCCWLWRFFWPRLAGWPDAESCRRFTSSRRSRKWPEMNVRNSQRFAFYRSCTSKRPTTPSLAGAYTCIPGRRRERRGWTRNSHQYDTTSTHIQHGTHKQTTTHTRPRSTITSSTLDTPQSTRTSHMRRIGSHIAHKRRTQSPHQSPCLASSCSPRLNSPRPSSYPFSSFLQASRSTRLPSPPVSPGLRAGDSRPFLRPQQASAPDAAYPQGFTTASEHPLRLVAASPRLDSDRPQRLPTTCRLLLQCRAITSRGRALPVQGSTGTGAGTGAGLYRCRALLVQAATAGP